MKFELLPQKIPPVMSALTSRRVGLIEYLRPAARPAVLVSVRVAIPSRNGKIRARVSMPRWISCWPAAVSCVL